MRQNRIQADAPTREPMRPHGRARKMRDGRTSTSAPRQIRKGGQK